MPTIERPPLTCPNGHPLGPNRVLVGWLPCSCQGGLGHRTYQCRACAGWVYRPEHVPGGGEQSRQLELAQATVTDTRTELAGLTVELHAEIYTERLVELREHLH
jgi:hypothetical protein